MRWGFSGAGTGLVHWRLWSSAATAIDEAIAQLDAPMLAAVETEGPTVRLDRSAHRRLHLGEIGQALQAKEEQQ